VRRLAPILQIAGILAAVFGLSKVHAVVHGYDYTQSSRFAWSLAYAGLLAISAYAAGLPDGTGGRSRIVVSTGAVVAASVGISLVQLALGSLLLPRLVVVGAGAVCVAWFVLVSTLVRDSQQRAGERDGVLLVAEPGDDGALLAHPELVGRASRLTAEEFLTRRREVPDLRIVDVRTHGEHALGSVEGADVVPVAGLRDEVEAIGDDLDAPVVVFCAGGYRSSLAASMLRAHGFTDVSDVLGGYGAVAPLLGGGSAG